MSGSGFVQAVLGVRVEFWMNCERSETCEDLPAAFGRARLVADDFEQKVTFQLREAGAGRKNVNCVAEFHGEYVLDQRALRASTGELHVSVYNATVRGSPFRVQLHADDADVRHNGPPKTQAGEHGSLNVTSLLGADYLVRKLAWSWWAWDYVPDFHAKLVCASAECHSAADSTKRTRVEYDESGTSLTVGLSSTTGRHAPGGTSCSCRAQQDSLSADRRILLCSPTRAT
jgi:hypothetical protein